MIKILSQSDIALFVRYFHKDLYISETDLRDYFAINMENDSKYDYLLWLYELIDLRIIKKVGKSFQIVKFYPLIEQNSTIARVNGHIANNFKGIKYCLFSTNWLNEFNHYQSNFYYNILEIEKALIESVFYILREKFKRRIYIYEEKSILERYVYDEPDSIVIKNILSRAPINLISPIINDKLQKFEPYDSRSNMLRRRNNFIPVPSLEKILVDLYCDKDFYYAFSGNILTHIFENALQKYSIDLRTLLAFAERRNVSRKLEEFIFENFSDILEINRGLR
jgi:hypothetical protein